MLHLMPHNIILHTRTMPQDQWGAAFEEHEHTIATYAVADMAEALCGWNKSDTQWFPASIVDTTVWMLTEGQCTALYVGQDGASDSEPTPDTCHGYLDHDPITGTVTGTPRT